MSSPDDPRWEWHEVRTLGGSCRWIRGRCNHIDAVPVETGGETVAYLCLTCDQQLPAEWGEQGP